MDVNGFELPAGFNYIVLDGTKDVSGNGFTVSVKCNISLREEVIDWVKQLADMNNVEWRVARTYPDSGRYNVFKECFRCQHNTHYRPRGYFVKGTRNTNCGANIKITIKRFVKHSKASEEDIRYPCHIILNNIHNHSTCQDDARRDVNPALKERIIDLFQSGHTPITAHHIIETEESYHDESFGAATRQFPVPRLSYFYNLFYKSCNKLIRNGETKQQGTKRIKTTSPIRPADNTNTVQDLSDENEVFTTNDAHQNLLTDKEQSLEDKLKSLQDQVGYAEAEGFMESHMNEEEMIVNTRYVPQQQISMTDDTSVESIEHVSNPGVADFSCSNSVLPSATYLEFCESLEKLKSIVNDNSTESEAAMKMFNHNFKSCTRSVNEVRSALIMWGMYGELKKKYLASYKKDAGQTGTADDFN